MYVWSFLYGLKWLKEYYLNNLQEKSSREEKAVFIFQIQIQAYQ